jgi:hypothetical protein
VRRGIGKNGEIFLARQFLLQRDIVARFSSVVCGNRSS